MTFASQITRVPTPFQADLGQEAAQPFAELGPEICALIVGSAGCSPYLKGLLAKHREWLVAALERDPTAVLPELYSELHADLVDLPKALRVAKGRVALFTALADLGGVWPLIQVTQALTDFADVAVDCAMRMAVNSEIQRRKLPDIDRPCGALTAIAMGKMGAGELNYSSDIDIICVFDGEPYGEDFQEARSSLVRATRRMASTLSEITADGYVFRTDLRLRPDAAVTPVALSMAAAESYYESVGRTWERAAYIKARACAGDANGGSEFLDRLSPFVWRRHLDFAAIQDAHDMRLRIRAHKGLHGPITLPGHNMKLGRGGIREIEFFTQTRQLIAGGRDPDLRVRGTLDGLRALHSKDWVSEDVSVSLKDAYIAHREVEHRLQMIQDAQTHDLPVDEIGFNRLAAFMGIERATLEKDLRERLSLVHELTESFFAPDTVPAKAPITEPVQAVVNGWYSYPALRSSRAVEIFERLKPDLLQRLANAARPEEALEQFDLFLAGLPAGVQVFSLFEANPQLVDLIADITATAPALARYLGRNAQVFDAVIGGSFFAPWPGCTTLTKDLGQQLAKARDYESQLDIARRWHKEWHFRIGVHFLRNLMSAAEAATAYADLAEAVLKSLWGPVVDEFARKHGKPPGLGAAVLGMGSLGARQLSATSDLDLIVIYDQGEQDMSDGARPLAARQYFSRLTQAFVTAISVKTAEGALYEVDMRLRPSGRQGPVATSLAAFESYQRDEAWTWEHLALTRARAVAGSPEIGAGAEAVRAGIVASDHETEKVKSDVAEMRERLAAASPNLSLWEAKRGAGRLQDIELLGQAAALCLGERSRDLNVQLSAASHLGWLSDLDVAELIDAHETFWVLQAAGRLLGGRTLDLEDLGGGARAFLLDQMNVKDTPELEIRLETCRVQAEKIVNECLDPSSP